jgi:hypothetical protein
MAYALAPSLGTLQIWEKIFTNAKEIPDLGKI